MARPITVKNLVEDFVNKGCREEFFNAVYLMAVRGFIRKKDWVSFDTTVDGWHMSEDGNRMLDIGDNVVHDYTQGTAYKFHN